MTEISFDSFRNPRAVLAAHPETPHLFVDYRELTTQPRATVQAIYNALQLPWTDTFDVWLQAQEDREQGHNTRFEYP